MFEYVVELHLYHSFGGVMAESHANVCVSDGVIWIPHTESHFSSSTFG
jgi:hypothetical protein